jgi:hypothetical protein
VSIDQLVVTLRTLGLPEWAEVTPTTLQSVDAA